jgi:hypothetical protein
MKGQQVICHCALNGRKGKLLTYFFGKPKPTVPKLITGELCDCKIGTHARRSAKSGKAGFTTETLSTQSSECL